MPVILLFIVILNVVSILLMYYCLRELTNKEKLVYIAGGTAIMYILTTIVYWISTRSIEISEVSETGKNLITFLFVPINGILILPLFAKSYCNYKLGGVDLNTLKKRGMVLGIILLIILIIECIYFKNVQEQVVNLIKEQQSNVSQEQKTLDDATLILKSNEINDGNQIELDTTNDLATNTTIQNEISENIISKNTNITEEIVVNSQINVETNEK